MSKDKYNNITNNKHSHHRLHLRTTISIIVVVVAAILGLLFGGTVTSVSIAHTSLPFIPSPLASTLLHQPRQVLRSIINKSALLLQTVQRSRSTAATTIGRNSKSRGDISSRMATTGESKTVNAIENSKRKTPVYFVSHGGPTTMFQPEHPVYAKLQALGREITQSVKPEAIVVFSAHWEATHRGQVEVNVSENEPLLYDFYGFPQHYYQEKFPNRGSRQVARRVLNLLGEAGYETVETDRGLDHGVFVPFKIMFDPDTNPVHVPIVQVSLLEEDKEATTATRHIKLGRAVAKLREENILIVVSGMAVHNLRHYHYTSKTGQTMPYAASFDKALQEAVESTPGEARDKAMYDLLKRPDARQAHPTWEHLLPIHVGVGAAGDDVGKLLWTLPEGSTSWAQYKFDSV